MGTENNTSVVLISFEIFCFLARPYLLSKLLFPFFFFFKEENLNRLCIFLSAFRFSI